MGVILTRMGVKCQGVNFGFSVFAAEVLPACNCVGHYRGFEGHDSFERRLDENSRVPVA